MKALYVQVREQHALLIACREYIGGHDLNLHPVLMVRLMDDVPEYEGEVGELLIYVGGFPLSFLRPGERVGAAGGGTGGCLISFENGSPSLTVNVGDTIRRHTDGSLVIDAEARAKAEAS